MPRPTGFAWPYNRAERISDAVVHALGCAFGVCGAAWLLIAVARTGNVQETASIAVYALGLVTMLGLSAAYNMWPVSPKKWRLRRFDHAAIYVMIAGTYTAFVSQMPGDGLSRALLIGVWGAALAGVVIKLLLPGRYDRAAIILYLLIGWSGTVYYQRVVASLPGQSLVLLLIGGVLYTIGVIFHAWQGLRFQNTIWHGFVLAAAVCHYVAILIFVSQGGVGQ
ncbi:MAG: hemolysin III family protein [Rhizobiales bacterium]|nr:hemolysin III family protein [Hyphomicrobiales bacterium]